MAVNKKLDGTDDFICIDLEDLRSRFVEFPAVINVMGVGIYHTFRGTDADNGADIIAPVNSDIRCRLVGADAGVAANLTPIEARLDALEGAKDLEAQDLTKDYEVGEIFQHADGKNYRTEVDAAAGQTPTTDPAKFVEIGADETLTTLALNTDILTFTDEDGVATNIDLSIYTDDTNLAQLVSAALVPATGIVTLTRDDATDFTLDLSSLISTDASDAVPLVALVTAVPGTSAEYSRADHVHPLINSTLTFDPVFIRDAKYTLEDGTEVDYQLDLPRIFMGETELSPNTAGDPILNEVAQFADLNGLLGRFIIYTGTDNAGSPPKRLYYMDSAADLFLVQDYDLEDQLGILDYDETETYVEGQAVKVFGVIFVALQDIDTAEVFTPAKWVCSDRNLRSGIVSGGNVTLNANPALFDIDKTRGFIVDNTTPESYLVTPVEVLATVGIANILTSGTTQIFIDVTASIIQQDTSDIVTELENISLGLIVNAGGNGLFFVHETRTAYSTGQTFQALLAGVGGQALECITVSPGATGLTLNSSAGLVLSQGRNYAADPGRPDIAVVTETNPVPAGDFFKSWITTGDLFNFDNSNNLLDPNNYNPTASALTPVPAGKVTVQRVYCFGGSNDKIIYYGRTLYDNLDQALQSFDTSDEFVENSVTFPGAFSAYVIVTQGMTDWNDPDQFKILVCSGAISSSWGRGLPSGGIGGLTQAQQQAAIAPKSTGLLSGGLLTGTFGQTVITIEAGRGEVVDNTIPEAAVETLVEWDEFTGIALTELAGSKHTYILIDAAGDVTQIGDMSVLTEVDRRTKIYLGVIRHGNGAFVAAINSPQIITSPVNQLVDLVIATGKTRSIAGNDITVNGTNALSLNKGVGKSFGLGINFRTDANNPNIKVNAATVAPGMLEYSRVGHIDGDTITVVPTTLFDPNGATTAAELVTIVGGSTFVAHRIWIEATTNLMIFQYGQVEYASEDDAISKWPQEDLSLPTGLAETSYLREIIVVINNETNLANATLIPVSGGSGGSGVVSPTNIVDDLLSTDPNSALSANQGRILDTADLASGVVNGEDIDLSLNDASIIKIVGAVPSATVVRNDLLGVDVTEALAAPQAGVLFDKQLASGVVNGEDIDLSLNDASVIKVLGAVPSATVVRNDLLGVDVTEALAAPQAGVLFDKQIASGTVNGANIDLVLNDASIVTIANAVAEVITGQFVGNAATFALLPTVDALGDPVSNGDWAVLTVVDGGNLAGIYGYNGAVYSLIKEIKDLSISNDVPQPNGIAAAGTGVEASRSDHVHEQQSDSLVQNGVFTRDYVHTAVDGTITNIELGKDIVFIGETALSPTTAGDPILSEIAQFASAQGWLDRHITYTGTDNSNSPMKRIYYNDRGDNIILIWEAEVSVAGQSFSAGLNSSQNINVGSQLPILWAGGTFTSDISHTAGASAITINTEGVYAINPTIRFVNTGVNRVIQYFRIRVNGATKSTISIYDRGTTAAGSSVYSDNVTLKLNAGDVISIASNFNFRDQTNALNTTVGSDSFLIITRIT